MELDIKKHGFELSNANPNVDYKEYTFVTDIWDIYLTVMGNRFTLSKENRKDYLSDRDILAHRYSIENQEQLDFLILNSRIGYLFHKD